jgi:hypothetical protein
MLILKEDISEHGLDGLVIKCKLGDGDVILSISGTAIGMLGMKIDDSVEAKTNILNKKLFNFLTRLDDGEILEKININSNKIIFVTNLGQKTFMNE